MGWPRLVTLRLAGTRRDFADLDGCIFCPRRGVDPANRGADPGNEFTNTEGLGDVVVGAHLECVYLLLFAIAHGQHQNGQARREDPDPAQRLDPADSGHIDIQ